MNTASKNNLGSQKSSILSRRKKKDKIKRKNDKRKTQSPIKLIKKKKRKKFNELEQFKHKLLLLYI